MITFRLVFAITVFTSTVLSCVFTARAAEQDKLPQQRQRFVALEHNIDKVSRKQAEAWYAELADYPLQPYLRLKRLQNFLNAHDAIEKFLAQYEGTPMDWPLRQPWLLRLAEQDQAERFLANYPGSSNTELQCLALRFQLKTKALAEAVIWQQTEDIWTEGKSQPKACDPLFTAWRNSKPLQSETVHRRLQLAAEGGQTQLIPYLKTLLPVGEQYLADLWQKTRRNPAVIARQAFFPGKHIIERDILAYGLKRLVWRSPDQALATWQRHVNDPYFTKTQRLDVQRQFAIALASKGDKRADNWLATLPAELFDTNLAQWQVAHALRELDWPKVQQVIEQLPAELQGDINWRYWRARALEEQGQTELANVEYTSLARERHYYGFMAAARIGLPPSLAHNPVKVSDEEITLLQQHPAVQRAQQWLALGRLTEARREWNHLQDTSDEQQKLTSAKLASQLQWHERAIFSLADVGYWDDVELRFPLAYQQEMQLSADKFKIDSGWSMAIARRESSFMADAYSPAGARGLMQIMPGTANEIAKKPVQIRQLYNPVTNIDYGTDYLNYLKQRNDGNLLKATAAYNAGYSRVRQWIPQDYALPADVWVETIPYRETREYVKAVMAYYQIYNIRMNVTQDVFKPLVAMKIGVVVE
ncbi:MULTISPECIES: transglycosylase SLT domain-containing protein [unclassified Arsukibacterium]|uniref:transglycosylase SLT domain-containing protein n=1 Tax=unclassified Arsukibacterium TaxID=2635278 RepID=UPI000C499584|nr:MULTISPECIES: transglycosylase SLT domain-containing protein [unclassified Arsukibacterium]MAA94085.1 murein transglycosylase [Rheinheimera sp.]MBM34814.1 murein transglycosylase [Rheinheimera sp.]